jgi:DNA-binding beta-propeller fold protein YncE
VMPHGSRVTRDGTRQYSACMMDDLLVEIDTEKMKLARTFRVSKEKEEGFAGLPPQSQSDSSQHSGPMTMNMTGVTCSPTWAQPSVDSKRVFVACNKSDEIVEIDTEKWSVTRRIPAGAGVYNLGVSPDGALLVATNKRGASVSIFDTVTGAELARLPTKRKVVHGVVISPDSRYAFVTVEGVGTEPGTVEIIDLAARRTVATVDTPPQAAGIDFWKIVSPQ